MKSESTIQQSISVRLDRPVTSLSISPNGDDVVLAAKRGLYIINLQSPFDSPRVLQHLTKWDVMDVQWNPHASRSNWIATTSNQKALIWNIARGNPSNASMTSLSQESSENYVEYILSKHARAVSDIHWSPFHPETIATCSYDASVHIWDLRTGASKPTNSFSAWNVGASQVKFNRINEWLIASSHDTDVRVWDARKASSPVTLITAHMTKIYGIDWSRRDGNELVTCSQDNLVKFWNINQPRICQSTITTTFPIWRARFAPFGSTIMTMPQRKDTSLYLWNCENKTAPLYVFSGHADVPIEFVWREKGGQHQLVTWGKDHTLRLWPVPNDIIRSATHLLQNSDSRDQNEPESMSNSIFEAPFPPQEKKRPMEWMNRTSSSAFFDEDDDMSMAALTDTPATLEEEISRIKTTFPSVLVDTSNLSRLMCTLSLQRVSEPHRLAIGPTLFLRIDVVFPQKYPKSPPTFDIQKTSMISMATRTYLSTRLRQISSELSEKSLPCIEACIKFLLGDTHSIAYEGGSSLDLPNAEVDSDSSSSDNNDFMQSNPQRMQPMGDKRLVREVIAGKDAKNVPFPRLCGATFSKTGKLIYFYSPLPHPSDTKFTAYTLSTRNQQPVLQSQHFITQPKSYPLYENYRAYVLSRLPKIITAGRSLNESSATEVASKNRSKIDFWLDDDPMAEDVTVPSLHWRPKPAQTIQPLGLSSADFLAQLQKVSSAAAKPSILKDNQFTKYSLESFNFEDSRANRISAQLSTSGSSSFASFNYLDDRNSSVPSQATRARSISVSPPKALNDAATQSDEVPDNLYHIEPTATSQYGTLVHVLDAGHLIPVSHGLAKEYKLFSQDPVLMCRSWQQVALNQKQHELAHIWNIAELILSASFRWHNHPFGAKMLQTIFTKLETIGDIQMLAMLICIFTDPKSNKRRKAPFVSGSAIPSALSGHAKSPPKSNSGPALRVLQNATSSIVPSSQSYMSYMSDILMNPSPPEKRLVEKRPLNVEGFNISFEIDVENDESEFWGWDAANTSHYGLLRPDAQEKYNRILWSYSELLFAWGLLISRAEILKCVRHPTNRKMDSSSMFDFCFLCKKCGSQLVPSKQRKLICIGCQQLYRGVKCAICQLSVKGLIGFCGKCEHGGHPEHLNRWFETNRVCPTGCGCYCIE